MGRAMADNSRRRVEIDLLAAETPLPEFVAATGYQPRTIRQIRQRYRESGPASLDDAYRTGLGQGSTFQSTRLACLAAGRLRSCTLVHA